MYFVTFHSLERVRTSRQETACGPLHSAGGSVQIYTVHKIYLCSCKRQNSPLESVV